MGIDRNNAILNMMYRGTTTIENFNWDNMTTVPILYLMTPQDIDYIKNLILSPRYSGNNKYKMEKIDEVMHYRGFSRFAGGTNRLVYIHPLAPNAVFKVAIDSVGINDNPAEFRNQHFLKPYCCKVFECTPCGTIASFEKVDRITTFEEFYTIADDYYYIIVNVILGKYVMDDIGIDYFMNVGIRVGCYPVLLDFPYLFELDGRKLECCNVLDDGRACGGEIDYDGGFNKLVCKRCGRVYRARDLAKPPKEGGILLRKQGGRRMKLQLIRGDKVVKTYDTTIERDYLSRNDRDVTGKHCAQVVLNRVVVETKKVTVPAPKTQAPKTIHKVVAPTPTKKVVKEITVSTDKPVAEKPVEPVRNTSVSVNLTKVSKPVSVAPKPVVKNTDTRKVAVGPKTEVTHVEPPIVGRVISVSVDKPKPQGTDVVKANTSEAPSVVVNKIKKTVVDDKKPEPKRIERIDGDPIVKADDSPKSVRTITVNLDTSDKSSDKEAPVEETPVDIPAQVNTEPEVVEDIDKSSIYPVQMNTFNLNLTGQMQQAVFFGDEPGGYYPSAEEETKQEEEETSEAMQMKYIDMIYVDSSDTKDVDIIKQYYDLKNLSQEKGHIIMMIGNVSDDGEISATQVKTYVCTDPENSDWVEVTENDIDQESIDVLASKISVAYIKNKFVDYADKDKALEQEEDESEDEYYEIKLLDKTPTDSDELEDDVFYCVKRNNKVDTSNFSEITDPKDIDDCQYRVYLKATNGAPVQVTYDWNDECWIAYSDPIENYSSIPNLGGIFIVDELPDIKDTVNKAFYLIRTEDHTDAYEYDAYFKDPDYDYLKFQFHVFNDINRDINGYNTVMVDELPEFKDADCNTYYLVKDPENPNMRKVYIKDDEKVEFHYCFETNINPDEDIRVEPADPDEEVEEIFKIVLCDKIPEFKDAENEVFYCVKKHDDVDTSHFSEITDPKDINPDDYSIYLKDLGELIEVGYDYDSECWTSAAYLEAINNQEDAPVIQDNAETSTPQEAQPTDSDDETDAMIAQLHASSKKKSLDDLIQ